MRGLAEIIRLRTGDCRDAADDIGRIAAGESEAVSAASAAHVAECLRCQAEVAAYRRILRHLRALRYEGIPTPAANLTAVLAALEAAAEQHSSSTTWAVRAVYVGGITVATAAAGAAGVLVWMNRRRVGLAETG